MNPLDPGPEVRAVWTEDSDFRRASAHFPGHTHVDVKAWGERVLERFGWVSEQDGYCDHLSHPSLNDHDGATWLEWGCGGGSVARAIKERCQPRIYHAIDISLDALGKCAEVVGDTAGAWLRIRHPQQVNDPIADGSVNYIISTSVFQHFPSFDYARAVLAEMRRVAAPSARGLISTRYFVPGDHYDPYALQCFPYSKMWQRYCAWQVPEFWHELEQAGFAPTDVVLEAETQHAWYRFAVKS